jgi:hypothetical protein
VERVWNRQLVDKLKSIGFIQCQSTRLLQGECEIYIWVASLAFRGFGDPIVGRLAMFRITVKLML